MTEQQLLKTIGDPGPHPELGTAESWRLRVSGEVENPAELSLAELEALAGGTRAQTGAIHCVSAGGITAPRDAVTFEGLDFPTLAAHVRPIPWNTGGREADPTVELLSRAPGTCGPTDRRHRTSLPLSFCLDPACGVMLAWKLDGEPLPGPNGGPLRSAVGPKLFFYKAVKWLGEIRISHAPLAERRGTWEEYAGYHDLARVERDERFEPRMLLASEAGDGALSPVAPEDWQSTFEALYGARDLSRLVAAQLHKAVPGLPRNFSGVRFARGPFAAQLRGTSFASATFYGARLAGANFSLSKFPNARFSRDGEEPADLSGCDFEGAFFNRAHLRNVSMRGAWLSNATFFAARDADTPTGRVEGLDVRGAESLAPETASWLERNGARIR